ncbi:MAG TPA: protein kinase, partial [Pirellulales bacterium]|nr:protein kinase [Pirellulales bacterium]
QAVARREAIGPASDVYALGVVLYELMTGRPPIAGGDNADTLRRVVSEHPPSPRKLAPRIPRDLEAICLKCLEKSPGRRYASAAALADDLRRFLSGEPTEARPVGRPAAAIRWARRQPLTAALAGLIVLVAIVSPLVAVNQSLLAARESQAQQKAEQSAKQETEARQLAEKAAKKAAAARNEAEQAAKSEAAARGDAERKAGELAEQTRELRRVLYQSRLELAHQAWRAGNMQRLAVLLEQTRPGPNEEDLRGFEWRYWWRRSHEYLWRAEGVATGLYGGVFSPDGRWLAVPSHNASGLRIFDARTGALHKHFDIKNVHPKSLAFSPNSSLFAYSNNDQQGRRLVLWEMASGQVKTVLKDEAVISNVAFAPDGKMMATLNGDRQNAFIRIWDLATGKSTRSWPVPEDSTRLKSFGYSADGKSLISTTWTTIAPTNVFAAKEKPVARVWDVATGEQRHVCNVPWANYLALLSPDRSNVVVHAGTSVRFWDCQRGDFDETSWEFGPYKKIIGYSPRGSLVACDADGTLSLLSCTTGEVLDEMRGHQGEPQSAVFSPDGRIWASLSERPVRELLVWDAQRPRGYQGIHVRTVEPGTDSVQLSAAANAGIVLTASAADPAAPLWDAATGAALETFDINPVEPIRKSSSVRVAIAHDGAAMALADYNGNVTFWKRGSPTTRKDFRWDGKCSLAFSPSGELLAAASGKIALWRLDTFQLDKTLAGHPVVFHDLDGRRVKTAELGRDHIYSIAFSPDGKLLASASNDFTVRLWEIATGQYKRELVGHTFPVHGVAFSPTGKLLASASVDRTVKLWDADSGDLLKTLQHADYVGCLAFAPDGKTLAVGGV